MGDGTGFDVIERLSYNDYLVVFITAFQEYAISAFKFNAIDFLLKPIDPVDLMRTLAKIEESIKNINLPSYLIIRFGKVKTKMSEGHKNPPFTISIHKASEFILDNLNKTGYIYTNVALKTIAVILKLLPSWMIKILKY